MAHAARVLSEDSPAAPAVRRAVEQGRVTVSDASRVIDEPAEVQLRALERVTGGGSRNLARRGAGAAPRWIAVVAEVIGGAGPASWRVWRTPARWVSPAGVDMGGGAAVVVSGPDVGAGDLWGWLCHLGPLCPASSAWDCSGCPAAVAGVESVARGGRRPGPALNTSPAARRGLENRFDGSFRLLKKRPGGHARLKTSLRA